MAGGPLMMTAILIVLILVWLTLVSINQNLQRLVNLALAQRFRGE